MADGTLGDGSAADTGSSGMTDTSTGGAYTDSGTRTGDGLSESGY